MNNYCSDEYSETVEYDNMALPVKAWVAMSEHFPTLSAVNHWHNDFELAYIDNGAVYYNVDGIITELHKGQLLLINSGHMHFGFQKIKRECSMICISVHPSVLATVANGKYLDIMCSKNAPSYLVFDTDSYADNEVRDLALSVYKTLTRHDDLYELMLLGQVYLLFQKLADKIINYDYKNNSSDKQLIAMHKMTGFIQKEYRSSLTINEISAAGLVCRSKCCEIFRKYLDKTPMEYLADYRIHKGIELLYNKNFNITEIAYACGFNSASYFTETFTRIINCTPTEYRKKFCINLK